MTTSIPSTARLSFLDGLRALAALWVVLGHCHLFTLGWNSSASLLGKPLDVLLYMHLGVNVFLVVSGFCLALPVVRNNNRMRVSLLEYFQARAWRILLPYYAVLILILLVNYFIPLIQMGRHPLGLTGEIPAMVLWSNFLLLQDFFPQLNNINGPFWSVATEWHLYFLFPLAVWLLRRLGVTALLLAGGVLAAGLTWFRGIDPVLSYTLLPEAIMVPIPPYFVSLFVMGMAAAALAFDPAYAARRARIERGARWIGIALMLPLGILLWRYRIIDGSNVFVFLDHLHVIDPLAGAVVAAFLVVLCGLSPQHRLRRALEARPLVFIGGFSYSLYLVHIPILALLGEVLNRMAGWIGRAPMSPMLAFWILALGGTLVCLYCAWWFARIFERRYRLPFKIHVLAQAGAGASGKL